MLKQGTTTALIASAALVAAPMAGCEDLPGSDEQQGAVGGGAAGAVIGGAVADDNRLLGALIGGAIGAGGGYLIGANKDRILGEDSDDAREADRRAQVNPARSSDVARADDADLNDDGFVTMDEVTAMADAGLSDREMVERLEETDQIFELTRDQEEYLIDQGVSSNVVRQMRTINQEERREVLERRRDVISRDRNDSDL